MTFFGLFKESQEVHDIVENKNPLYFRFFRFFLYFCFLRYYIKGEVRKRTPNTDL